MSGEGRGGKEEKKKGGKRGKEKVDETTKGNTATRAGREEEQRAEKG